MEKNEIESEHKETKKYEKPRRKVVFLGDSSVGKTSLINSFFKRSLDTNPTVGGDRQVYHYTNPNTNMEYDIDIWDTAGQEQYRSIAPLYLRNSDGIFLVFSFSDRHSFLSLPEWLKMINDTNNTACIVLIGNKIDIDERYFDVDEIAAREFADQNNLKLYYLTSAKNDICVRDAFAAMFLEITSENIPILAEDESIEIQPPVPIQTSQKSNLYILNKCCA